MPHDEAHNYIEIVKGTTLLSPEDQAEVVSYIIPVNNGGTRVECLNPQSCCCKNDKLEEKLEIVHDRLDRVDGIMFPVTRKVITEKTEN
jgi:hypothetical protein